MNQTMYMALRVMIRILDEVAYSHQKINSLGTDASFNIDENSAYNTLKYFRKVQQVSALDMSFNSTNSSVKLCIWLREKR